MEVRERGGGACFGLYAAHPDLHDQERRRDSLVEGFK